jgi:hypothetical protein
MKKLFLAFCFIGLLFASSNEDNQDKEPVETQYVEVEVTDEPMLEEDKYIEENIQEIEQDNKNTQVEEEKGK